MGDLDPVRDRDIVTTELTLADLTVLERRLDKVNRAARSGDKDAKIEAAALQRIVAALNEGLVAGGSGLSDDDLQLAREVGLLTVLPVVYAANVLETDLDGDDPPGLGALRDTVREHGEAAEIVRFAAEFEAELADLEAAEQAQFLASVGLESSSLDRFVTACYQVLGLETFFTFNDKEARAWTLTAGSTAYDAAGKIHSDFQRGFIRAETIPVEEFITAGSHKAAREHGLLRSEGRDYVVQDGDILLFRFNV
jgi:GTP-binding protein YchF